MYKHLLVPIDGSELDERAAQHAIALAQPLGARITAFVVEPFPPLPTETTVMSTYPKEVEEHRARTEAHARDVLARFAAMATAQGVPCAGEFRHHDSVDRAIVTMAEELGCDLVVMATHGRRAFGEMLFGSHARHVLALSRLPLLVLH
jgi:nucleotide-binding universal stress UspA family protein